MIAGTSRRRLLAGLAASPLLTLPAGAAEPHPDAAILDLEPAFRRRIAVLEEARDAADRIDALVEARCGPRPEDLFTPADRDWLARAEPVRAELNFRAADDAIGAAHDRAAALAGRMLGIAPRTLDGLCCKARVIRALEYDPDEDLIDDILAVHAAAGARA